MEKLNPASGTSYSPAHKSKRKEKKKKLIRGEFSSALDSADEALKEHTLVALESQFENKPLEALLDDITAIGEKVKQNPTFETIKTYKSAAKSFMKYIVDHSLFVDEKVSSPNILRQKKFTIIRIIDEKLDRLAAGILMNQKATLDILARVDEINGLLVDLLS